MSNINPKLNSSKIILFSSPLAKHMMMKANIDLTNNELYYLEREKLELDEPTASH